VKVPYPGGEEEEFQSILIIEEPPSPTQTGSYIESTTPCVSQQSEVTFEYLSKAIVVSQGGSSSSSHNSGSNTQSQNQSQPTLRRGGNTSNNMVRVDN
jgi:hypothetical protein